MALIGPFQLDIQVGSTSSSVVSGSVLESAKDITLYASNSIAGDIAILQGSPDLGIASPYFRSLAIPGATAAETGSVMAVGPGEAIVLGRIPVVDGFRVLTTSPAAAEEVYQLAGRTPPGVNTANETVVTGSVQVVGSSVIPAIVDRITVGLIFRDQFNRPDSPVLGNDWRLGGAAIKANKFHIPANQNTSSFWTGSLTANRYPVADILDLPNEYMVQGNVAAAGPTTVDISARENGNFRVGQVTYYAAQERVGQSLRKLRGLFTGSTQIAEQVAYTPDSGTFYGQRLILEGQGDASLVVSGAWTLALSSSEDLNAPFTDAILSDTVAAPFTASETNIVGIIAEPGAVSVDEYIIQGTKVVVTNLPSGFKVKLDDDAAIVESGGSGTINVRTRALPYTTMTVLNASDVVQAQASPQSASLSDGWGGDIYNYVEADLALLVTGSVGVVAEPTAVTRSVGIDAATTSPVTVTGSVQVVNALTGSFVIDNQPVTVTGSVEVVAEPTVVSQSVSIVDSRVTQSVDLAFDDTINVTNTQSIVIDARRAADIGPGVSPGGTPLRTFSDL